MAERRMFAKTIIDSDAFLEMQQTAQLLYFHLSMRADDEGFINNPKSIMRNVKCSEDDLRILALKKFIIPFESGVVVIKHWKIHNYIRNDRLIPTKYAEERSTLEFDENGAYRQGGETLFLTCNDMRKEAYEASELPYSFTYKIRRAFEGKECPICGKTMTSAYKTTTPSIQHNIPISKGGEHELGNISVICLSCNTSIRDTVTDNLNNNEVIEVWDKIKSFEKRNINWFDNTKILFDSQMTVKCLTSDSQLSAQDSIGKDSIGKDSIGNIESKPTRHKYGKYSNILLSDDDFAKWKEECIDWSTYIERMSEYCASSGKTYKNYLAALRNWYRKDGDKPKESAPSYDIDQFKNESIHKPLKYERKKNNE